MMPFPRFILPKIMAALTESPVVLINGARQTGKTTLVKILARKLHPAQYVSFDDFSQRSAAHGDPHGFLKYRQVPVVIDEVQLVPELLSAIKLDVDHNRRPADIFSLPSLKMKREGCPL